MDKVHLPKPIMQNQPLTQVMAERRSARQFNKKPLTLQQISQLMWAGQGITEQSRGFRTAPSAGALYPVTLYLVTHEAVWRYEPHGHDLVKVMAKDVRQDLGKAALGQDPVLEAPADIVIAADYAITAAKYGGASAPYVNIEVGHVAQNILLMATVLNLAAVPVGAFYKNDVAKILQLPRKETPLYIIPVGEKK